MNSLETLLILIVDDEPIVSETLGSMLELNGHTVETASNGLAGKEALMQTPYDAAFVDVRMPGLNGIKLLKWSKEYQLLLPIVIMSGHGDEDLFKEALQCGAYAFLKKPFSYNEVELLTSVFLKRRQ